MRIKFNPFDGSGLDFVSTGSATEAEAALKVQEEFDVYGTFAVGDLVVPSGNQAEAVESISDNYYYPRAVFGIIIEIISPTRAKVLITGKLSGSQYQIAGLTFGKSLFVSSTGKLVTAPPTTGPLQKMGIALKSDGIFLLPSLDLINRV